MSMSKRSRRTLPGSTGMTTFVIAVLLAAPGTASFADEPEKKKPAEKVESTYEKAAREKNETGEVRVYTNADLEGAGDSSAAAGADGKAAGSPALPRLDDPMVWMRKQQQQAATRTQRIASAEAAVKSAHLRVSALEKQLLAVSNPFSARPELDEEEQEAREAKGETALERRDRTQKMLDEARKQLQQAERALLNARTERPR